MPGEERGSRKSPRVFTGSAWAPVIVYQPFEGDGVSGEGGAEHMLTSNAKVPGALGIASNALLFIY